jgi:hypothetical protein
MSAICPGLDRHHFPGFVYLGEFPEGNMMECNSYWYFENSLRRLDNISILSCKI